MNNKYLHQVSEELNINIKDAKNYLAAKKHPILKGGSMPEIDEQQYILLKEFAASKEDKLILPHKLPAKIIEIQEFNNVDRLVFEGVYHKIIIPNKTFGILKNIIHLDTNESILYPNGSIIEDIFTPLNSLEDGKRYTFEVELSTKEREIKKRGNPYLLQVKHDNISLIEEVSLLADVLLERKQQSLVLEKKIAELNVEYKELEQEYNVDKAQLELNYLQKQQELQANFLLEKEKTDKEILEYEKEIQLRKQDSFDKIAYLKEEINENEQKLVAVKALLEETGDLKRQVETSINILQNKLSLCKQLGLLSAQDIQRYLNVLVDKNFIYREESYHFEKDFQGNFYELAEHIHAYLFHNQGLIYTRFQIFNFLALLKTHDIIVLSGLSGSGKTQIIKAFANALGGVAKIIPVKPNWTSSDDLIGYYNPIQMSFVPTPFTEAIVEAITNPNQLYFICLDEMNLARAEYYFADFLSKLEERSKEPEIELYAKHEEEMFISEFQTFLSLIEDCLIAENIEIHSWQDFLNNKNIRNRFFEMLGNTDKESILQMHSKMKRRLIDILKFPSTIKIPANVRFIGAINVDETTHYFSPKILDRVHIMKFENPLLFQEKVVSYFENKEFSRELKPVYMPPKLLGERKEYPQLKNTVVSQKLQQINKSYLLDLNIDFGVRSIRQAMNYAMEYLYYKREEDSESDLVNTILNTIINQKILPRFVFAGDENSKNGVSKLNVLNAFANSKIIEQEKEEFTDGKLFSKYLSDMIKQAESNHSQINFFA